MPASELLNGLSVAGAFIWRTLLKFSKPSPLFAWSNLRCYNRCLDYAIFLALHTSIGMELLELQKEKIIWTGNS